MVSGTIGQFLPRRVLLGGRFAVTQMCAEVVFHKYLVVRAHEVLMVPRAATRTYGRRIHVNVGMGPRWLTHVRGASTRSTNCLENIVFTSLQAPKPDKSTSIRVISQRCLALALQDTHMGR